jgi:hypothetical protein
LGIQLGEKGANGGNGSVSGYDLRRNKKGVAGFKKRHPFLLLFINNTLKDCMRRRRLILSYHRETKGLI